MHILLECVIIYAENFVLYGLYAKSAPYRKRDTRMKLTPDRIFPTFDALTAEFLLSQGISALVLDIDNTLIPYEESVPTERVRAWLSHLKENGISVAFVSNNHKKRLDTFNASLGYPAFYHGCKPFPRKMRLAMRAMGAEKRHTANLGDQIFTDILGGRLLGLKNSFLVPPIKDKTDAFTRFKRWLEKPYIKKYKKREEKA